MAGAPQPQEFAESAAPPAPLSQEERAAARRASRAARAAAAAAAKKAAGIPRKTLQERREATAARAGKPPPPKPKLGHPQRITVPKIAEALAKTGGLIGVTAQFLKCERRTVEKYVARYPSLQEVRDQAREEALDHTEWALIKAARAGEPWAVQWFLRYQGKARGYQEIRKTEQESTVRVEVAYTEDALRSGQPTTTVTQISQLPPPAVDPVLGGDGAPRTGSADAPQTGPAIEIVEAEITFAGAQEDPQEGGGER